MAGERYDVLILGGGTAGCVLAARLSEEKSRSVCLVEAGPDPGPYEAGGWPEDMLDARALPTSHGWGFDNPSTERARIIGGCSAHNACFVVWGSPADYDEWAIPTGGAWTHASLEPHLRRADTDLRARPREDDEIGAWDRAYRESCEVLGYRSLESINDPSAVQGIGTFPVNAVGTVRWNTAFAHLDPARTRPNLTIVSEAIVDRVAVRRERATGAMVVRNGRREELRADLIVLASGTYGTPAILLRSGIGPEDELDRLSIPVSTLLDGVGRNLSDHYGSYLEFAGTDRLRADTVEHARARRLFQATTVLKAGSEASAEDTWDLHLIAWTDTVVDEAGSPTGEFRHYISVKILKPRSFGSVRLRSSDPGDLPAVDLGFLSDPEGADLTAVVDGLRLVRRIAEADPLREVATEEIGSSVGAQADEALAGYARQTLAGYFHPVGTCRMGSPQDPTTVVDPAGKVHGFENLCVADASIMPTIPRANTNLTVVAIAERISEQLSSPPEPKR